MTITVIDTTPGPAEPVAATILVGGLPTGGVVDLYTDNLTGTLTAVVYDKNGTVLPDETVLWSSSNSSIVTISENGVYTAKAAGLAVVTAAVKNASTIQMPVTFLITNTTPITPAFDPTTGTTEEKPVPPAAPEQVETTVSVQGTGDATIVVTITPQKTEDLPELPASVPKESVKIALDINAGQLQPAAGGEYSFTFTLPRSVAFGTTIKVLHYKTNSWKECQYTVDTSGNIWKYTVYTDSFSPFAVTAADPVTVSTDNGGADDGAELLASVGAGTKPTVTAQPTTAPTTTETTKPTGDATTVPVTTAPTTPAATTAAATATATQAPAPIAGILAGLFGAAVLLRRKL